MKRPHISEQLIGYCWLLLIVVGIVVAFVTINRHDRAAEQTQQQREYVRYMQDSIQQTIEARERQRAEWAEKRAEREKRHQQWEAQRRQWAREKAQRQAALDTITICLRPFDPNTADSSTFVHLGLTPRMAGNILRYRAKGGKFRQPADFRRVYDMTDTLFLTLEPYIVIGDPFLRKDSAEHAPLFVSKRDTIIEINHADTAELQLIRGIGSFTAKMIVQYREGLGGYYTVEQLREIKQLKNIDSIMPHLVVDTMLIRKIAVNRLSVEAMQRHKYISFDQAKAIRDYRHRKGDIRDINTLRKLSSNGDAAFTDDELQRLRPYLDFQ